VDRALAGWNGPEARDYAVLLVNELVVNAIQHAGTPVDVTVSLEPGALEIGVHDGSHESPTAQESPASGRPTDEEHGRGLMTVNALADEWGVEEDTTGKTVWFRLDATQSIA
jgi:anti-sigma regulatory factor (Ser/Thr protein kinase)